MKKGSLTQEYAEKIRPLVPLAQKAYGAKSQSTPAHAASREYTRLLVEYHERGGSLVDISKALQVSYAGVRRRVFTATIPSMNNATTRKTNVDPKVIDAAVERVRASKHAGTAAYHAQLAHEYYENGISLSAIAKGLGAANTGPLYYGVQRHTLKSAKSASA